MSELASNVSVPEARVLVVDDEDELRSVLTRFLDLLGYETASAATGYVALRMLEESPYDVAVMDIRMPGMDGIEVMQRARKVQPDLAVVFLTGHASLDSAMAAVRSHAADYLIKPISNRDLATAVANALQWRAEKDRQQLETLGRFLQVGVVTLDLGRRVAIVAGRGDASSFSAKLTTSEMGLLLYLMQRPGVAVSCQELAESALSYEVDDEAALGIVRPHVCRLRKKLEPTPEQPPLIRTVPGKGYLFFNSMGSA